MSLEALKKLAGSSKANVLMLVIGILVFLLYTNHITAEQLLDTIKVIVPGWMLTHAGEQGAKAIANGKTAK